MIWDARCHMSFAGAQAMAKLHAVGYREDDVYLHCAPLFHIGGLSSMVAMLAVGATQVRLHWHMSWQTGLVGCPGIQSVNEWQRMDVCSRYSQIC